MSEQLEAIRNGYNNAGGAVELGAAVADGAAHPDAVVRLPLSSMNRHGLIAGATGTSDPRCWPRCWP